VLRDEVRAPDVDLTPKIGELGVEAADLRVHGLEPRAGVVEPGLQRLTLAPAVVSSTAWNSACARAMSACWARHSVSIAFSRSAQDARLDPDRLPRRGGRRTRAGGEAEAREQCERGDHAPRAHTRCCRKSVTSGQARSASSSAMFTGLSGPLGLLAV
jgi:hypothetical protein